MTTSFNVLLSSKPINSVWGENNNLSYNESGATIHISDLQDCSANMNTIQKAARKIATMNLSEINLVGQWSLESQWHFWQGAFAPNSKLNIEFAELPSDQKLILDNRVKTHEWVRNIINLSPEDLSPMQLAIDAAEFITELAPESVSHKIISAEELLEKGYVGLYGVGRGSVRPAALLELEKNRSPGCQGGSPDP